MVGFVVAGHHEPADRTLSFTDVDLTDTHSVGVVLDSAVWSADPFFVPGRYAERSAVCAGRRRCTIPPAPGTAASTGRFSIPDQDLDFLSDGETLTVTYDVTVSDGLTSSTQRDDHDEWCGRRADYQSGRRDGPGHAVGCRQRWSPSGM